MWFLEKTQKKVKREVKEQGWEWERAPGGHRAHVQKFNIRPLFFVKGESPIFVVVLLTDIWGGPSWELL